MLIAQIEDGQIIGIGEPRDLFPSYSFPASGPEQEFMQIAGCMFVYTDKPFDPLIQSLQQAPEPYIENGAVYTAVVVDMTQEEQDNTKLGSIHNVKVARNSMINRCNWTQLPDSGLPLEQVMAWAEFRQAVRQASQDFEDSDLRTSPTWPTPPDDLDDYKTPWLSKVNEQTPALSPASAPEPAPAPADSAPDSTSEAPASTDPAPPAPVAAPTPGIPPVTPQSASPTTGGDVPGPSLI